jgi:hypothetical protein
MGASTTGFERKQTAMSRRRCGGATTLRTPRGTAPADVTEFDQSWTGQFSAADWYLLLKGRIDSATVSDIAVAKILTVDGN